MKVNKEPPLSSSEELGRFSVFVSEKFKNTLKKHQRSLVYIYKVTLLFRNFLTFLSLLSPILCSQHPLSQAIKRNVKSDSKVILKLY